MDVCEVEKFSGKIAAPYGEYGNPLPKKTRRPERQSRENFKCGLLYSHGNAWQLTHTQKPYIKLLVSLWC